MISRNQDRLRTAEVNHSATMSDIESDSVHHILIERLSVLAETTARSETPQVQHTYDTAQSTIQHQPCTPTLETTLRSTHQQSPSHPCPRQQLTIAAAEWRKLLSKSTSTAQDACQQPSLLTSTNQKENNSWGDQLLDKGDNVTRVYSLNVNGLSVDRRGGRFDDLCKAAKEVQTDILCCQEHNLDTTKYHVRSILYDTTRQHWNRSRLISGTTPTPFDTNYKPGGTMIVSIGDITGRIAVQSHDKWGRWTSQTFRGTNGVNLTVISAYQVVTDNPHTGLTTATSQQQSLLVQSNDKVTPRRAFKRDLCSFLRLRRTQGDELLLVGDFNEELGSEIDGMSQIAAEFQLLNLMQTSHSSKPPPTYARGRKCLDYGLATHHVASALIRCGYEAFNERFATDHRAYYFDLDTEALFGNKTQHLASHSLRVLKSNNIEQVISPRKSARIRRAVGLRCFESESGRRTANKTVSRTSVVSRIEYSPVEENSIEKMVDNVSDRPRSFHDSFA
jgi:exonuclease III